MKDYEYDLLTAITYEELQDINSNKAPIIECFIMNNCLVEHSMLLKLDKTPCLFDFHVNVNIKRICLFKLSFETSDFIETYQIYLQTSVPLITKHIAGSAQSRVLDQQARVNTLLAEEMSPKS